MANAPPKSAKVLVDQESGYENGLEDTTIPRKAVIQGGLGTNPEDFEINVRNLLIVYGEFHFIWLVLENGTISVLNQDFYVGESLAHEYVWATMWHKAGTIDNILSREKRRGGGYY